MNVIIARFRENRYLVRESELFIKDKTRLRAEWVVISELVLILATVVGGQQDEIQF